MLGGVRDWTKESYELVTYLTADQILDLLIWRMSPGEVVDIVGESMHQKKEIYQQMRTLVHQMEENKEHE